MIRLPAGVWCVYDEYPSLSHEVDWPLFNNKIACIISRLQYISRFVSFLLLLYMKTPFSYLPFVCLFVLLQTGCKKQKTEPQPAPTPPSAAKAITSFVFQQSDNSAFLEETISGLISNDTVNVTVPAETNRTQLKPTIVHTGAAISGMSGAAQDFSSPVTYTVKAADGSSKNYTVIVKFKVTLFFGTGDGKVYSLEAASGAVLWSKKACDYISGSATVQNGVVYIYGNDGLYALRAKNGAQKWKLAIPGYTSFTDFDPTPYVKNGTVYVGCTNGNIYAVDTANGAIKWTASSRTGAGFCSSATMENSILYIGCSDSSLYAVDAASGSIKWRFDTHIGVVNTSPLVANGIVYTGALGLPHFYALNAVTGSVIWDKAAYYNFHSATIANGKLYYCPPNSIEALDPATGNSVWLTRNTPGLLSYSMRSSPIVANNITYYGCLDGKVYANNALTGAALWNFTTGAYIYSSPVVANNIVYIGSRDGFMYALDATTGTQKWRKDMAAGILSSPCVTDGDGVVFYASISGHQN